MLKSVHPITRAKSNMKDAPSINPVALGEDTKTARLFRNGANQAVRIPREFELPGSDVTIRRVAGALVIEPMHKSFPQGSPKALLAALATLKPLDESFPDVDAGLLGLDDVDV
jgi:antitoxin VapB